MYVRQATEEELRTCPNWVIHEMSLLRVIVRNNFCECGTHTTNALEHDYFCKYRQMLVYP